MVSMPWSCHVMVADVDGTSLLEATLEGPGVPDLEVLDAVALLALHARRRGAALVLVDATPTVVELIGRGGLLGVEVRRQPECRKQAVGVEECEEEAHLRDLSV